jgi:uncharacterized membrane protein AbrB (regulator of aidB expression)
MASFARIVKFAVLCALAPIALVTTAFARSGPRFASPKVLAVLVLATQVPFASSCMVNSPIKTSIVADTDTTKVETNHGMDSDASSSTDIQRYRHTSDSRSMHVGVETTVLSFIVVATILLVFAIGCCSAWIYNRYTSLNDAVNVYASTPPSYS